MLTSGYRRRPVLCAVGCFLCLCFALGPMPASSAPARSTPARLSANSDGGKQQDADVRPLEAAKQVQGELKGGNAHSYQITLPADHYVEIVVEQEGINLIVALSGPDGQKLMEVDSAKGKQGTAFLTSITPTSG